jgi:hypothetical protein
MGGPVEAMTEYWRPSLGCQSVVGEVGEEEKESEVETQLAPE